MRCFLAVAAVAVISVACARADDAKREAELLQGVWAFVSGEHEGKPLPQTFVRDAKRVIKGDETSVIIAGGLYLKAKFTLDADQKPKAIDYTVTAGTHKGKTQLGIYELDGEILKICVAPPGADRPKDFSAKEGSGCTLTVWKPKRK